MAGLRISLIATRHSCGGTEYAHNFMCCAQIWIECSEASICAKVLCVCLFFTSSSISLEKLGEMSLVGWYPVGKPVDRFHSPRGEFPESSVFALGIACVDCGSLEGPRRIKLGTYFCDECKKRGHARLLAHKDCDEPLIVLDSPVEKFKFFSLGYAHLAPRISWRGLPGCRCGDAE